MNNTGIPTNKKIAIPLRVPQEIYEQVADLVHKRKKEERGYSINQYITDILTKELKKKSSR